MAPLSLAGHKLLLNGLEFAGSPTKQVPKPMNGASRGSQCLLGAPSPGFKGV
jgi:hypothetical protein